MDTKLTIRVPIHLFTNAKRHAQAHQTTLTELISVLLATVPIRDRGSVTCSSCKPDDGSALLRGDYRRL